MPRAYSHPLNFPEHTLIADMGYGASGGDRNSSPLEQTLARVMGPVGYDLMTCHPAISNLAQWQSARFPTRPH